METSNKTIAKNTAFLYIRMLLVMIVTFYTSRVILDVLGAEDYGIYNTYLAYQNVLTIIICLGLDGTIKNGYFEFKDPSRLTDSRAQEKIRELLHMESGTKIQELDRVKRNKALRILKDGGLSIRQIERLTGITRGIVMKA